MIQMVYIVCGISGGMNGSNLFFYQVPDQA